MRKSLLSFFLISPFFVFAQQKGDNTIKVKGVNFSQICTALLDAGFIIEKKDNDLQTVKTEFKEGTGKNKWMKLAIIARVKDSAAFVTGQWFNTMFEGQNFLGKQMNKENLTDKIEYTSGNPKNCFKEMTQFALTLGKELEFLKQ